MIRTGLIFSAAAFAVMAGAIWWLGQNVPADVTQLPVHWGPDGRPDRFLPRAEALQTLWILPGVSLGMAAVMAIIPAIDPFRGNIERSARAYLTAWIGAQALLVLAAIGAAVLTVRAAGGDADGNEFVRWIIAGTGLLFVFLGDALPKTRPNFFVGVRTPWTLMSDLAWQKTHRLAGWLFVLAGLWTIAAAFLFDGIHIVFAMMGPILLTVAVSAVHSWMVWRTDPDRRTSFRRE